MPMNKREIETITILRNAIYLNKNYGPPFVVVPAIKEARKLYREDGTSPRFKKRLNEVMNDRLDDILEEIA